MNSKNILPLSQFAGFSSGLAARILASVSAIGEVS
jgi:hypothetical protein